MLACKWHFPTLPVLTYL